MAGILTGAAVDIVWLAFLSATGLYEIIPGFFISLIVAVFVSLITPEPEAEVVELFDRATK